MTERISISMIVKNESSCIEKCLESVKDADEIIVVDTGSEDNTIELVKKYTDKVYFGKEYDWRDDFAFSRNQSLEKCSGDWILIIDADEELEKDGIQKIRELIKNLKEDTVFFKTTGINDHRHVHNSIRLFKNNKGIKWHGKIHNYLSVGTGYNSDIKLYYGYSNAHKKDPDRAFRILGKVVIENPECVREKFYLAREYWYRKKYKTAIFWYEEYLKTAHFGAEMADAHMMLAYCYRNINNYVKAREHCLQAIALNTNFKEALLFMESISGPGNAKRWREWANTATNEGVLFVRTETGEKK